MFKKRILFALIFSIIIVYIGIKWHKKSNSPQTNPILVEAILVKETTLPMKTEAIGTLIARSVEITPESSGHVQKILFTDGSAVKTGDPLIQLDDAIYRAKFESARAKYIYSKNNFSRMVFLGKRGVIAQQAIDQAEADLKEKKADADEAEVLLQKMKLVAPFDGFVGKCRVNPGDYVTVGTSVVTLTDTKHLHGEYNLSEKYLPLVKLNQEVNITTSAYPNEIFKGKVAFISPTINSINRSILLYAEIENTSRKLAPGMFVNISQALSKEEHAILIPARSVVPILDGEQVYKIVNGKAVALSIVIGKRTDNEVQVLQGLHKGDVIITDGQLKIKNGESVRYQSLASSN